MSVGYASGLRALLSAQSMMNIIGHNLANQNTPGYSRQVGLLTTTTPMKGKGLIQIGTGVHLADVYSVVNETLLSRIRSEVSHLGMYAAESSLFDQIEAMMGDLTESGLASKLQTMFDSATEAGTAPEDMVLRQNLLSTASELALAFHLRDAGLSDFRTTSLLQAETIVTSANQMLQQVAELNTKIHTQESIGTHAADLKDQRSNFLEALAETIGASATVVENGTVNVAVNGVTLVSGGSAAQLDADINLTGQIEITTGMGGLVVNTPGGQLGGIMSIVENYLPTKLADLDKMAKNIILEMNKIHSKGVPAGGPFTQLESSYAVDVPAGLDPLSIALSDAGLPFDVQAGTLSVAVSTLGTGNVDRYDIPINPTNKSVGDFLNDINSIPQLNAFLDGAGKLHIKAAPGYGFDFSKRLDAEPVEGGTFGAGNATMIAETFPANLTNGSQFTVSVDGGAAQTVTFNTADFGDISNATADEVAAVLNTQVAGATASVVDGRLVFASNNLGASSSLSITDGAGAPAAALGMPPSATGTDTAVSVTVSGATTSEVASQYTFKAKGDGEIGIAADLEIQVYDGSGVLVTTLNVGDGYEPGSPIEIVEGVFVEFSPGSIQGSANQFFDLELPGNTDTSDVLAAFGVNAFFQGTDASTIAVSDLLEDNPEMIAGAAYGGPGDGDNFLAMAELANMKMTGLGGSSITSYYNAFSAEVGTSAAGAASSLQSSTLVLLTLETQRAAESGVNPDEEMLALERYQNAYEAAAKFLSVLTELDDVLLQL